MASSLNRSPYPVLESSLQEILVAVKPSAEDQSTRVNVINNFKGVVQSVESLRGATVEPFGSFISNLYTKWGDLDISVELSGRPFSSVARSHKQDLLREIMRALRRRGVRSLEFIPRARVPLLKFESSQRISCDISVDNLVGQVKSKYFLWISQIDERFRDMVLLVKEWAKTQDINDPKNGSMNSFSLTLLVIFHFQTCQPSILPPLKSIFDGNIADHLIGMRSYASIETTCLANVERFKRERYRINQSSLSELFVSFFKKFSNIKTMVAGHVISTFTGTRESVWSQTKWRGKPFQMLIEDPFEQTENAARSVGLFELSKIAEAFEDTHHTLSSSTVFSNKESLIRLLVRPHICSLLGVRAPVRDYRSEGHDSLEHSLRQMRLESRPSSSVSSNGNWTPWYS